MFRVVHCTARNERRNPIRWGAALHPNGRSYGLVLPHQSVSAFERGPAGSACETYPGRPAAHSDLDNSVVLSRLHCHNSKRLASGGSHFFATPNRKSPARNRKSRETGRWRPPGVMARARTSSPGWRSATRRAEWRGNAEPRPRGVGSASHTPSQPFPQARVPPGEPGTTLPQPPDHTLPLAGRVGEGVGQVPPEDRKCALSWICQAGLANAKPRKSFLARKRARWSGACRGARSPSPPLGEKAGPGESPDAAQRRSRGRDVWTCQRGVQARAEPRNEKGAARADCALVSVLPVRQKSWRTRLFVTGRLS